MASVKDSRELSARVIPQAIFALPRWREVSSDARTILVMILCGKYSTRVPGLALANIAMLADEMEWGEERALVAIRELETIKLIYTELRYNTIYCPHILATLPEWATSTDPDWIATWMRPVPKSKLRDAIAKQLAEVFGMKAKDY